MILEERRKSDRAYEWRRRFDLVHSFFRSCAVCTTPLPPIDLLCPSCWRTLGRFMNRAGRIEQLDYPFPVYSLLTWTPATEAFVKPFIYAFKGGRQVRASRKLADLFLSERSRCPSPLPNSSRLHVTQAPGSGFDHAALWARSLCEPLGVASSSPYIESVGRKARQKQLRQDERTERRFEVREHFAGWLTTEIGPSSSRFSCAGEKTDPKRIVFADDVVTSGATAMAAFMALGDPSEFEVWSLVARPRLAGKSALS